MNTQLKLKFYYDHVLGTVYNEGPSMLHETATKDVIEKFIDPLNVPKDAYIVDLGCGPGYFLDNMKQRGYTNITGITLSPADIDLARSKGHRVERRDLNFLPEADCSVDMLFSRHSLEHSPFPYITLLEYNRVLKPNGILYVEVPAPDCDRRHEYNKNHFSILGKQMWLSLFERTGFAGTWSDLGFDLVNSNTNETFHESYYVFVLRRTKPVDVK